MRVMFKNGATRARAAAWAQWLAFATVMAGTIWLMDDAASWSRGCLLVVFGLGSGLILVRLRPRKIPVLNYHSVSGDPEWLQIADRLSISPDAFERQLAYLARHGYRSVFVSEAHGILAVDDSVPFLGKPVALTFDDGYADNWIAVLPLLRKYGFKATVFVSPGFIADADRCRPTMEEAPPGEIDWSGYLTWPELRAMQHSGLMEIQSHGVSHARVFTGAGPVGFIGPRKSNRWLLWETRPETRTHWWRGAADDRSLWGHPVFPQAAALAQRAYRPDPEAVAHMMSWAAKEGGELFGRPDWERRLHDEWVRYRLAHGDRGGYETNGEYVRRLGEDLGESRQVLERRLGRPVEALCWPENRFSAVGGQVARRVGYRVTVSNRHDSRNVVGEAPDSIVRVFIGRCAAGFRSAFLDDVAFILEVKVFEGWYVLYPILAVMHLSRKILLAARRV